MKVRKAISPVIATLLLILIAVAASILVYVWVTGYASSVTSTEATQLQERIKIDAVGAKHGNSTGNYYDIISIFVRNIGDVKANVSSIYIYDNEGKVVVSVTNISKGGISPGATVNFTIALNYNKSGITDALLVNEQLDSSAKVDDLTNVNATVVGVTYTVKVVTLNGVESTYKFRIGE